MDEACRMLGVPMSQLADLRERHPNGSWIGLLLESVMWLVGSLSLLYFLSPVCSPSGLLPPPPAMQLTAQHSRWAKRERDLFGSIPYSWGDHVLTHKLSLSPTGENGDWEGLSWLWAVPSWARGDIAKVKLSLTFFSVPNVRSFFFFFFLFLFSGMLELPHWTPGLHRGSLICVNSWS